MKMFFKPIGVENDHPIKKTTDSNFFLLIQQAALLGLKDEGDLTEMQHRHAEENLLQQFSKHAQKRHAEAVSDD